MPVVGHTDPKGELLVSLFFERVTAEQLIAESTRVTEQIPPSSEFSTLIIFEPTTELSYINTEAINAIREARKMQFADRGLRRRAGAAVIDAALDAKLILHLWNALSEADPELNLSFKAFQKIGPALDWLGFSMDQAQPVIDATFEMSIELRKRPFPSQGH